MYPAPHTGSFSGPGTRTDDSFVFPDCCSAKNCAETVQCSMGPHQELHTKRLDHSRKRRRLLLPARIVEKESWKGRTPIFKDAHQVSSREVLRHAIFGHPGQAGPVERSLDHQV